MDAQVIWETGLDGKYSCTVTRNSERMGQLRVRDKATGAVILDKEVSLSYGAAFGPDVDDVMDWEDACIMAVDKLGK
jgi:hypothetical protein